MRARVRARCLVPREDQLSRLRCRRGAGRMPTKDPPPSRPEFSKKLGQLSERPSGDADHVVGSPTEGATFSESRRPIRGLGVCSAKISTSSFVLSSCRIYTCGGRRLPLVRTVSAEKDSRFFGRGYISLFLQIVRPDERRSSCPLCDCMVVRSFLLDRGEVFK